MLRLAQAAGVSTRDAIAFYTIRRGSILRFSEDGGCVALDRTRCGLHRGRPLACRLYPLGIERTDDADEKFVLIEPAAGSLGIYGIDGTVDSFLASQGVGEYIDANARYASLLPIFRERIAATVDFDRVEPREFWRRATHDALAESSYDPNPLIDAMFDVGGNDDAAHDSVAIVAAHIQRLADMIRHQSNGATLAAAAVMLAVSLGYSPRNVM